MTTLPRQKKIIAALGIRDGQTFQELTKSADMSRETLMNGLKELMKKEIIKKSDDKKYHLITETKNKTLEASKKFNLQKFDLDECMKELAGNETPFEIGYTLLRSATFYLQKLSLERFSPNLTNTEKLIFEQSVEQCTNTIEKTFEVLGKIDMKQTMALKKMLDVLRVNPRFEFQLAGLSNKRQKRRADKITHKIYSHFPQ